MDSRTCFIKKEREAAALPTHLLLHAGNVSGGYTVFVGAMSWCIIFCVFNPPGVGSVVEPSVERLEVDGAGPSRNVGNLKLARALAAPVAGCTFDFSAAGLGSDVERFLLVFAEGTDPSHSG